MATNAMRTTTRTMPVVRRGPRRMPVGRMVAWAVLLLLIFVTLFPFWWVIRTALSTQREIFANTSSLLPVGFTWNNFARVLGLTSLQESLAAGGSGQKLNFFLYLRNSVVVAAILVVAQTFFSALAAYSFARLHWPGREQVFFIYLSALMVPGIVTLIPNFILVRSLHWQDTFLGIVAPGLLISPFAIFFLRQFFLNINHELEEAAKLDGASLFGIFWRVIVPLSGPPIATLAILTFVASWNNYLWPFLVGQGENVRVLTVALAVFRSQTPQGSPDWTGMMAATLISMIPTVFLFLVLGRRVINSIQFSGFK